MGIHQIVCAEMAFSSSMTAFLILLSVFTFVNAVDPPYGQLAVSGKQMEHISILS
jgi:hypothetical protein